MTGVVENLHGLRLIPFVVNVEADINGYPIINKLNFKKVCLPKIFLAKIFFLKIYLAKILFLKIFLVKIFFVKIFLA